MKRGGPLRRKARLRSSTPLSPGKVRLKRTQMRRVGKRREREAEALAKFTDDHGMRFALCSECRSEEFKLDAHHLCSRARGAGHPLLHDTRNRAWLCRACHDSAHRGELPHLIRGRDYLDQLLLEDQQ